MLRIKEGFKGERVVVLPAFFINEIKQDPLGKELYITDIGYYPHAHFHYRERMSEEAHEFVLIYCVEGEGWFQINGNKFMVTANQFFILPKNKSHAYSSNPTNPWTIYWMHFNGEKATFFSEGFDRPCDITPQEHSRIKERLNLFEEIYTSLNSGYSKSHMLYATTSLFHFLGSMKFIGEYRDCGSICTQHKDTIQLAIHYMQENLNKKLCLTNIANEVKLSVSYFSAQFEESTGYSPLRYLTYLRVQEACRYLDFTSMKINQISPLVGFEDPLYFSRLFTKTMGMSPSEYKSRQKG
ncbi:AraC family transcriptional regulator [uncultured Bacteroides sp.]|uniref:AraC family transcriptional regulator n=1 Tax=uncultured Bacteroides sp. TaxID=162156 RepID=UPI002AA66206|nr:AraC family transcriptional regulator [uncultured Bacteroides sp.]